MTVALLAVALVAADPVPIVREWLPPGRDWTELAPARPGRWERLTLADFDRRVDRAAGQLADRAVPKLIAAKYRADPDDDGWTGTAEWTFQTPGAGPRLWPVEPGNCAVRSARWDDGTPARWTSAGLFVEGPGPRRLLWEWSAPWKVSRETESFEPNWPPSGIAELDFHWPYPDRPNADGAMTIGPGPDGRWRVLFGGSPRVTVRAAHAPRRPPPVTVTSSGSYRFGLVESVADVRLRVGSSGPLPPELEIAIPSGWSPVEIAGEAVLGWACESDRVRVRLVESTSTELLVRSIAGVAPGEVAAVPEFRVVGSYPRGETIELTTVTDCRVDHLNPSGFRLTEVTQHPGPRLAYRLESAASRDPRRPEVRFVAAGRRFDAKQRWWWTVEPGRAEWIVRVDVTAGTEALTDVPFRWPPGWVLRSATVANVGRAKSGTEWVGRLDPPLPPGSTATLQLTLARPVPATGDVIRLSAPAFEIVGAKPTAVEAAIRTDANWEASWESTAEPIDRMPPGPWVPTTSDRVVRFAPGVIDGTLVLRPRPSKMKWAATPGVKLDPERIEKTLRVEVQPTIGSVSAVPIVSHEQLSEWVWEVESGRTWVSAVEPIEFWTAASVLGRAAGGLWPLLEPESPGPVWWMRFDPPATEPVVAVGRRIQPRTAAVAARGSAVVSVQPLVAAWLATASAANWTADAPDPPRVRFARMHTEYRGARLEHRFRALVSRSRPGPLPLQLPEHADGLSASLDGRSIWPVHGATAVIWPGGDTARWLELRYSTPADPAWFTRLDLPEVKIAGLDWPVARTLGLPDSVLRLDSITSVEQPTAISERQSVVTVVDIRVVQAIAIGAIGAAIGLAWLLPVSARGAAAIVFGIGSWWIPPALIFWTAGPAIVFAVTAVGRLLIPGSRTRRIRTATTAAVVLATALAHGSGPAPYRVFLVVPANDAEPGVIAPRELLDKLDALAEAGEPNLSGVAQVLGVNLEARVHGGSATLSVHARVLLADDRTARIELPGPPATIAGVVTDGTPVVPQVEAGRFFVPLAGCGEHEIHWHFELPLAAGENGPELTIPLPTTPIALARVAFPAEMGLPTANARGRAWAAKAVAGESVWTADLGLIPNLQLRWRTTPGPSVRPAAADWREAHVWDFSGTAPRMFGVYWSNQAVPAESTLTIAVPASLQPLGPPAGSGWSIEFPAERDTCRLRAIAAMMAPALVLEYLPPPTGTGEQPLPWPSSPGALESWVVVRGPGDWLQNLRATAAAPITAGEFRALIGRVPALGDLDDAAIRVFRRTSRAAPVVRVPLAKSRPPAVKHALEWAVGNRAARLLGVARVHAPEPFAVASWEVPRAPPIVEVGGPGIADWYADENRLTVWWDRAMSDAEVKWATAPAKPLNNGRQELLLPSSLHGTLAIRAANGWRIRPVRLTGLKAEPPLADEWTAAEFATTNTPVRAIVTTRPAE